MAVAMLIAGPDKVFQSLNADAYMPIIKSAACYVVAALVSMTNVAVVALALEGKNIWLIKSLPIAPKTLYNSYLLTNLTFTIPTAIVCSILFSISLKTGVIGTILMILTPLTFALFTSVVGIFVGNRLAYYDWQDETQLIKQSTMTIIGLLGGMVLIVICGAIANTGILPLNTNLITFIFNILFLVLTAVIYLNESNRPIKA
jgi:ABC-2 type transport system permease protein